MAAKSSNDSFDGDLESLERQFAAAMIEWRIDGDGWDVVAGDGLNPAETDPRTS